MGAVLVKFQINISFTLLRKIHTVRLTCCNVEGHFFNLRQNFIFRIERHRLNVAEQLTQWRHVCNTDRHCQMHTLLLSTCTCTVYVTLSWCRSTSAYIMYKPRRLQQIYCRTFVHEEGGQGVLEVEHGVVDLQVLLNNWVIGDGHRFPANRHHIPVRHMRCKVVHDVSFIESITFVQFKPVWNRYYVAGKMYILCKSHAKP